MPEIMAQYPETKSIGSIGSIILAILEVQVYVCQIEGSCEVGQGLRF